MGLNWGLDIQISPGWESTGKPGELSIFEASFDSSDMNSLELFPYREDIFSPNRHKKLERNENIYNPILT